MLSVNVTSGSSNLAKIQIVVDRKVIATIDASVVLDRISVKTDMFDGCSHEFIKNKIELDSVIVP